MEDAKAYVAEAELALSAEADPAAVGAAVTVELCGHWEHEGPCHWPHNNAIRSHPGHAIFRTLFVADPSDAEIIRERIEAALGRCDAWRVMSVRARPVEQHEQTLAERLLAAPRSGIGLLGSE